MNKPTIQELFEASVKSPIDADLSEASFEDALNLLDVGIAEGVHLFEIRVGTRLAFSAARISNRFNKEIDNWLIRVNVDEFIIGDKWFVIHIESGKTFYSPGV